VGGLRAPCRGALQCFDRWPGVGGSPCLPSMLPAHQGSSASPRGERTPGQQRLFYAEDCILTKQVYARFRQRCSQRAVD